MIIKCLIDLDGILVDFIAGACELFEVDNPYKKEEHLGNEHLDQVLKIEKEVFFKKMGYEFWANLGPTCDCFEIIDLLENKFGIDNICILTKPIMTKGCADGKIEWIRKYLPEYYKRKHFLLGPCKHFCASPHALLIDDAAKNINNFALHNGETILVPRPWNKLYRIRNSVKYIKDELDKRF